MTVLFLFYGTLRASTFFPTVLTLLGKKQTARGVFAGVIVSLAVGLPIFGYGSITGDAMFKTIGSLCSVLMSGLVALSVKRWEVRRCGR